MKKAFTLAEVLITLTIIGVIAALTIPNLMQSWRKHERITQVKEAYSIIQNAVKMSIAENGSVDSWTASNSCDFAEKYIFPYLKLQYRCGGQGDTQHLREGCFVPNENGGTWYWLNGVKSSGDNGYGAERFCKAKLQNGMDFGVWRSAYTSTYYNDWPGMHRFVFDVNGAKGSTTMGNDVFAFYVRPKTSTVSAMTTWGAHGRCTAGALGGTDFDLNGFSCAQLLETNSWQFPKDYPVKKF